MTSTEQTAVDFVDALAQEIRRVDGSHKLGAGALAEALAPFLARHIAAPVEGCECDPAQGYVCDGCENEPETPQATPAPESQGRGAVDKHGFDAIQIDGCTDVDQIRNWAHCMRRERDQWREDAQWRARQMSAVWNYVEPNESNDMDWSDEIIIAIQNLEAHPTPTRTAGGAWRCFHCDEAFTDRAAAVLHFGEREHRTPGCQIDLAEYRRMEGQQDRYAEEDADCHRALCRERAEHAVKQRRAEEAGYARGLKDAALAAAPGDVRVPDDARQWVLDNDAEYDDPANAFVRRLLAAAPQPGDSGRGG
jgi:hypothetical protein